MKGNKGITLIALVITIIVLLILAGVSIAMLSGENSILSNGRDSSIETAIANAKEEIAMKVNEYITEYYRAVYADGNNATNIENVVVGTNIQTYVVARLNKYLESMSGKFDGLTSSATTTAGGSSPYTGTGYNTSNYYFTLTYTGETKYSTVGSIDAHGTLKYDDSDDLKTLMNK